MRSPDALPLLDRPLLLSPDNFTPRERTPWGGTRIAGELKADLGLALEGRVVGESWELCAGPELPSGVEGGATLAALLASDPQAALGREAAGGARTTALLVKLLDTAHVLSVQIHPADDYDGLAPGESGKPECWYVVAREPGAGICLGLREGVTRAQMEAALRAQGDVATLLFFTEVEPGDFFVIAPGTPHSLGAGLTLVEPQRVAPGRRGVTYRYYDFGRRYDAQGRLDPSGSPRALHARDALAVTDWEAPRGAALLARARLRAGPATPDAAARIEGLCAAPGGLPSSDLRVLRVHGTGSVQLEPQDLLRGLTVLAGTITLEGPGFEVRVARGRTAALPARLGPVTARCEGAHAVVCSVA